MCVLTESQMFSRPGRPNISLNNDLLCKTTVTPMGGGGGVNMTDLLQKRDQPAALTGYSLSRPGSL